MMTMTATTSLEYAEKFFPWSISWFPKTVDRLSPLATEWAKLNPNKVDRRRLALYLAVLRIYQDRWTEAEDALLLVFPEGGEEEGEAAADGTRPQGEIEQLRSLLAEVRNAAGQEAHRQGVLDASLRLLNREQEGR